MTRDVVAAPPPLVPFDEACVRVVEHLRRTVPMAFWSVTRFDGTDQVYLCVEDDAYGRTAGDRHAWSDSFCRHMVAGDTPRVAPAAMTVPAYAAAGIARTLEIGAYIGIPLHDADGTLFGTLCGLDPAPQPDALVDQEPVLHLLASLLEQILQVERWRDEAMARREELQWRAFHDHQTGLPNRAMFLDRMGRALDRPVGSGHLRGVLVLDLDDFKAVNDALGHTAGDELMVGVVRRLAAALPATDLLARLAGDEFGVLVVGDRSPTEVAARMRSALRSPIPVGGTAVTVSTSIGVSDLDRSDDPDRPDDPDYLHRPDGQHRPDVLLARADLALTTAKHAGKDRVVRHRPAMTLPGTQDVALREPLRRALADGQVTVAFQPIVSLVTGETVAFETLARWSHDGRPVPPDVFVPVASRGGLMSALTDRALDLAAAQLARWATEPGRGDLRIGVNVSPQCIGQRSLVERVDRCMRRHGVDPGRLVLEITEEALLVDVDTARAVAHELAAVGVRLSLDDFGAGYSSLLHLQQIPLTSLKIDRGFVADLDTNPATARFMRALLALGRDLDLGVIVEGVERVTQADILRELGCELAQGYLFGRPQATVAPLS